MPYSCRVGYGRVTLTSHKMNFLLVVGFLKAHLDMVLRCCLLFNLVGNERMMWIPSLDIHPSKSLGFLATNHNWAARKSNITWHFLWKKVSQWWEVFSGNPRVEGLFGKFLRVVVSPNMGILPIGSMYGIFTYIYHRNQPNVGKYTIHGSYGIEKPWKTNVSPEGDSDRHKITWTPPLFSEWAMKKSLFNLGCFWGIVLPMLCENYFITQIIRLPIKPTSISWKVSGRIFFVAPVILATTPSQFHGLKFTGERLRRWKRFSRTSKRAWPMLKMQSLRAEDEVSGKCWIQFLGGTPQKSNIDTQNCHV